jgi:hypothetical protein
VIKLQIVDVYDKDYTCGKCNSTIQYAKIKDNDGNYVTEDGKPHNKKFGKDDNRLSGAVDKGTTNLHGCSSKGVVDKYNRLTQGSIAEQAINSGNPQTIPKVDWGTVLSGETANQTELKQGYEEINSLAYNLTEKQHPELSDQENVFGQIVHAKSLVLTNLLIAKNLKKLRDSYDLAHKSE